MWSVLGLNYSQTSDAITALTLRMVSRNSKFDTLYWACSNEHNQPGTCDKTSDELVIICEYHLDKKVINQLKAMKTLILTRWPILLVLYEAKFSKWQLKAMKTKTAWSNSKGISIQL